MASVVSDAELVQGTAEHAAIVDTGTMDVFGIDSAPSDTPPTPHELMLSSIARTALLSDRVRIPLVSREALEQGNARVRKEYGEKATRLLILGPDVIVARVGEPNVLRKQRAAELFGLMVFVRDIIPPKEYLDLGFFKEAKNTNSRVVVASQSIDYLVKHLIDGEGNPIPTWHKTGSNRGFGLPGVLIKDMRHSPAYGRARQQHSTGLFERYILEDGPRPSMAERPMILAARAALTNVVHPANDENDKPVKLTRTQQQRFIEISRQQASMLSSRTDANNTASGFDTSRSERIYLRQVVADAFEPKWQDKAACRGPQRDLFFPPLKLSKGKVGEKKADKLEREERAKAACASCPIKEPCLENALARKEPDGIWGGLNTEERNTILGIKRRRRS